MNKPLKDSRYKPDTEIFKSPDDIKKNRNWVVVSFPFEFFKFLIEL